MWTSASAALQQAREVVDERVKHLPNQEYAAKLREEVLGYVPKNLNREELGKLGNLGLFFLFVIRLAEAVIPLFTIT